MSFVLYNDILSGMEELNNIDEKSVVSEKSDALETSPVSDESNVDSESPVAPESSEVPESSVPAATAGASVALENQKTPAMPENPAESIPEKKGRNKKRRNPIFRFIRFIFLLILFIILAIAAWVAFSIFNKKNPLAMLPPDYSMYVRMDSAWDTLNPLLDLRAADILLSSPDFKNIRGAFMAFRASPLRQNPVVAQLASRRVDLALYTSEDGKHDFVAVMELGPLSAVSRLAPFVLPHIKIKQLKDLSYVQSVGDSYFEYKSGDSVFYVKPCRNLLVAASSPSVFEKSMRANNDTAYTNEEIELINQKTDEPVHIVMDSKKLLSAFVSGNDMLNQLSSVIAENTHGVLSLGITDSDVNLSAKIPCTANDQVPESITKLISRNSTVPSIINKMSGRVQYYTVLNIGSVQELKEAAFPLLPKNMNAESLWSTGQTMSKMLFGMTLDELLYSWTGDEICVLGMEGTDSPVFAIQVTDEDKRQKVFKKLMDSILLKDDTSLILDGVRLPRVGLPKFFEGLLSLFKVTLPSPYYMVFEDFIYFSESAQALSGIYTSVNEQNLIAKNMYWREVSEKQSADAAVSMYYNLEKSVPFFLRGDSAVTKALSLYSIGRCDIGFSDSSLVFNLSATARHTGDLRAIPGFPIKLEGAANGNMVLEKAKNPAYIYWTEKPGTIKSMEAASTKIYSLDLKVSSGETVYLASAESTPKQGLLWAVTSKGTVYLLNNKLEAEKGFPLVLRSAVSGPVNTSGSTVLVPLESGDLAIVDTDKSVKEISLPLIGQVKSAPAVLDRTIAVYDKSFAGSILILQDGVVTNAENPLPVDGIAFGSPALLKKEESLYVAFITQAGSLSVWKDGEMLAGFPIQLEGVFYNNVVTDGSALYVLSSDAMIYRVSLDGTVLQVHVPDATSREGLISVIAPDEEFHKNLYVSIDGNLLYGFSGSLELLSGFPVVGFGVPAFVDVNGDKSADCFVLTLDKKLNAWNIR